MISSNSAYGNTAYSSISSLNSPEETFNQTAETDGSVKIGVQKNPSSAKSQVEASLKQAIEDAISSNRTNGSQDPQKTDKAEKRKDEETEQYFYHKKSSDVANSFDVLAAEIGAVGGRITKEQLASYYQHLMTNFQSGQDNTQAVIFVKNLLAKFDTLSDGADYITSLQGMNEPQDYKTVTKEQVTPPIDIRI